MELIKNGVIYFDEDTLVELRGDNTTNVLKGKYKKNDLNDIDKEKLKKNTIAYRILKNHNTSGDIKKLKVRFDALTSHDITYVGIVQTARASGLKQFPIPYALTNCHNSLCAVGGTINEDDHVFGLSAAKKYGGIYVPAHLAVIHQYIRETMTDCGSMILGSDSHTRYGALGTMGVGEGGPELVKQILSKTYDINFPEVVGVYLEGKLKNGIGPQDVALAIIGAVFKNGFVKNKVLEFIGPGIKKLSMDFRNGIDVMTTETTCLSSIWKTDDKVKDYYKIHGRHEGYLELKPKKMAYYDNMIVVDLSKIESMIALPFHPSNVYTVKELNENTHDILNKVEEESVKQIDNPLVKLSLTNKIKNGKLKVDQGIVAGCAGGSYENIFEVANIVNEHSTGNSYFNMSVYPASQPIFYEMTRKGLTEKIMNAGITLKTAFCGPCFGAGDTPSNGAFSIRHTTRNFPSREGSKPIDGQISSVALMDARSIAATAINGGFLTPATEIDLDNTDIKYTFNKEIYNKRVYNGFGKPSNDEELKFGPNISEWPKMIGLTENLLLKTVSVINDPVTTTDELIPSGETSSYRSNPLKLAEFTLSRKDPKYVSKAKDVQLIEKERLNACLNNDKISNDLKEVFEKVKSSIEEFSDIDEIIKTTGFGSTIFAVKPGDGSAREQAASCQKVLGGWANIANEYATKRYRSNLINWGMLPFTIEKETKFNVGDYIFIPNIKEKVELGEEEIDAKLISENDIKSIKLFLKNISKEERKIILKGCLINYYNA
ncbi:MAG: hydratase [Clostridiales bacterium]